MCNIISHVNIISTKYLKTVFLIYFENIILLIRKYFQEIIEIGASVWNMFLKNSFYNNIFITCVVFTPNESNNWISYLFSFRYLEFLFDSNTGGPVRLQDFKDICDSMSLTPQGIEALTNFLMNNIERILRQIPTGESIVTYMYRILASKVALDVEIAKVRFKINS